MCRDLIEDGTRIVFRMVIGNAKCSLAKQQAASVALPSHAVLVYEEILA